jgi:hypothetical protein
MSNSNYFIMSKKKDEEIERNEYPKGDKKSKGVCFAFVEIREYEMVLGDNPSVTNGPPISLGWAVESISIFTVDMYERSKDPRARHELQVPAALRVRHRISQYTTLLTKLNMIAHCTSIFYHLRWTGS